MSGDSQDGDDYGRSTPSMTGSWSSLSPQEKSFVSITTPPIGSHEEPCGDTNCFPLILKHWEKLDAEGTRMKARRFSPHPNFSSRNQPNFYVDLRSCRSSTTKDVTHRIYEYNTSSESCPPTAPRSSYVTFTVSGFHPCPQPLSIFLLSSSQQIFPYIYLSVSQTFLPFEDGQTLPDMYLSRAHQLSVSQQSFLSAHEFPLQEAIKHYMNQNYMTRNLKSHKNHLLQNRLAPLKSSISRGIEESLSEIKEYWNQEQKSRNFKSHRNKLLHERFVPYNSSVSRSNEESSTENRSHRKQKHKSKSFKSHRNHSLQDRFTPSNSSLSSNRESSSETKNYKNQKYKTKTSKSHRKHLHYGFAPYSYFLSRSNGESSNEVNVTSSITSSYETKSLSSEIKLGEMLNKIPVPNSKYKNPHISKTADIYKPKARPLYLPELPKLILPDIPKITIPKLQDILNDPKVNIEPVPKNVAADINKVQIIKSRSKSTSEISASPTSCVRNVLEASVASWETYSDSSEAPDVMSCWDCYP